MTWRSSVGWLILGWALAGTAWAETAAIPVSAGNTPAGQVTSAPDKFEVGPRGIEAVGGTLPVQVQSVGNSTPAQGKALYSENRWLEDFEVHFLVSLPFTALYGYAAVSAVDASVQGRFPTTFKPADMWVVLGLALGSSLAVALGSVNRVPDQSVPRLAQVSGSELFPTEPLWKMTLMQIDY